MRRQIEAAEQWAETEGGGLELDTSLRDEGVSGFNGRNAEIGALGTFLTAIRDGRVARGSVLLVENLDRISRHDPLKAMRILETVVEAGVDVVTLQDRRRYTRENIAQDVSHLIVALITFARGNEESRTKSNRLCSVWSRKRRDAVNARRVMSTWVNPWIRVVGVKREGTRTDLSSATYALNEDRATTVRQIFAWAGNGWGYVRIARELRARRVAPWNRAGWTTTRIAKVIKNRAVLGECQLCRYEGGAYGKRVPEGPPIQDYFPRVVSDEVFERAQPATASVPRGRPHKRIHLLSGLVVDSRGRIMYVQAQAGGKSPNYQTAPSLVEYGESAVRWSAEHLERCVVAACREIDWNRLYATDTTEQDRLEAQIEGLTREETSIARKLANAAEAVLEGGLGEAIKTQVQLLEARLPALRAEKKQAHAALEQLRRASTAIAPEFAKEIPMDFEPRERLQAQLRTVLKRVQVWPDGRTPDPFWRRPLEFASEWAPKTSRQSISYGNVMGACRLFFKNERAITAYVTFVRVGKNRAARVIGFANPHGMTPAEWDAICSYSGMYAKGAEAEPRVPTIKRQIAKR